MPNAPAGSRRPRRTANRREGPTAQPEISASRAVTPPPKQEPTTPPLKQEPTTPPLSPTLPPQTPSSRVNLQEPQTPTSPRCTNTSCERHGCETIIKITSSNKNYNEGRPHWRCQGCNTFYTFADEQGICNRRCWCGIPSRVQAAGQDTTHAGALFFKCAQRVCGFWEWARDPTNPNERTNIIAFDEVTVRKLKLAKLL